MDRIQRELYPSIDGRSRLEAFPDLRQTSRPFSRAWVRRAWDIELVLTHLADYQVPRRVDRKGQVSIYNRNHYVGKQHGGKGLFVGFDPLDRHWLFMTAEGVTLRHKTAEEITRERIVTLQVSHRRQRGKTQCRD